MLLRNLVVALLMLCCTAGPARGASIEKAKALYQNNLLDDAKRELIEVLYAPDSESADKALSLFMLGTINERQGQADLAAANWRELIEKFRKPLRLNSLETISLGKGPRHRRTLLCKPASLRRPVRLPV